MNNQIPVNIIIDPLNENCYEFKLSRNIFTKDELIQLLKPLKTVERYILPEIGVPLQSQYETEILQ